MLSSPGTWLRADETGQHCLFLHIWRSRSHNSDCDITIYTTKRHIVVPFWKAANHQSDHQYWSCYAVGCQYQTVKPCPVCTRAVDTTRTRPRNAPSHPHDCDKQSNLHATTWNIFTISKSSADRNDIHDKPKLHTSTSSWIEAILLSHSNSGQAVHKKTSVS